MKGWRRRSRASVVRAGAAGVMEDAAEGVQNGRDGSLPGASDGREEFAIGRTNHAGRQYDLTEAWRRCCSALIWPGDLFIGES